MTRVSIEDCIAVSEDFDWFAFPAEYTRGQVIGALAAEDSSWFDTLRRFQVKRGYVVQGVQDGGAWYWEAEEGDADAIAAWIVRRK